jgi:predicted LPLAT superfamily acyltransferase
MFPIGGTATIAALLRGFNAALTMLRKSEVQFRHNPCNESFATAIRQPRNSRCALMNSALLTYMSTCRHRRSEAWFVDIHVNNCRFG